MAIIAKKTGGDFIPAPAGVHQAVGCDVVDLGVVETAWGNKHMVRIVWEINEKMEDGRRFTVNKRYTLSLHEKASLRKDLESWRARQFTEQELQGFDVETVLGANCMVNVTHNTGSQGGTFANVSAIMPLYKQMQKIGISGDYVRIRDREPEKEKANGSGGNGFDNSGGYDATDDDVPF